MHHPANDRPWLVFWGFVASINDGEAPLNTPAQVTTIPPQFGLFVLLMIGRADSRTTNIVPLPEERMAAYGAPYVVETQPYPVLAMLFHVTVPILVMVTGCSNLRWFIDHFTASLNPKARSCIIHLCVFFIVACTVWLK